MSEVHAGTFQVRNSLGRNRLLPSAGLHFKIDDGILFAKGNLLLAIRLLFAAEVGSNFHSRFSSCDFTPNPTQHQPVLPAESFWTDVILPESIRRLTTLSGIGIAYQDAS